MRIDLLLKKKNLLQTNIGLPGWWGIGLPGLLHWPWVMGCNLTFGKTTILGH